jgi:hypothetical protein
MRHPGKHQYGFRKRVFRIVPLHVASAAVHVGTSLFSGKRRFDPRFLKASTQTRDGLAEFEIASMFH